MPRYTFTGEVPAILVGLIQGINADHAPAKGNPGTPEGSTIVAHPGDSVDTFDLEYLAASLEVAPETPADPPAADNPEANPPRKS